MPQLLWLARLSQPQRTVIHFLVCLYQRLKLPKPLAPFHDPDNPRAGLKKGVWGESRLTFESIVEEVRRFVARMPPVDSTTGSVCCLWSFSALGDQRAEMLPVERPPAFAVGGRCMMRLTRILMFPFFLSASWISAPYIEVPSKMPRELLWKPQQDTRV